MGDCANLIRGLEFEFLRIQVFENASAFKFDREDFIVHCDPTRLEFRLVNVHVVFGYRIVKYIYIYICNMA